jgi:pimeloyl-ACP methyl ester carboxylesterase
MGTFRTAAGVGLNVETDGPEDAPVTVVLAHGWTLDLRTWAPVARALTAPGRAPVRVLRYDHRAHGRSDLVPRSEMTLEALADDLAELLTERVPAGPIVLAGHSMGGMAAMALAERHPGLVRERVAGLVLVSTACGGLAQSTLGLPVRMLGMVRRGEAKLAASERFDARPTLSRRPGVLRPSVRFLLVGRGADADATRISARSLADCRPAAMIGFRPAFDTHERDDAMRVYEQVPTEVLVGSRDKLTPVAASRRIAAASPWARLTVYGGAGHMLPVERVGAVTGHLAELCARAAATRAVEVSSPGSG